jgi:hypothetical protein
MPAKKKFKLKIYKGPPRPRGRPATGKKRTASMPNVDPEFYDRLKSISKARRTSIARAVEYCIDIAHLQTFHM